MNIRVGGYAAPAECAVPHAPSTGRVRGELLLHCIRERIIYGKPHRTEYGILSRQGRDRNIVPELTARGFQKAFVCSDPDLIRFNVTKKVTDLLDAAGFAYEVYSDIKPNPTIENVQTGVAAFRKSGADCIVAIGGGSSMDTAKAIGVIIENPEFADVRSLEA